MERFDVEGKVAVDGKFDKEGNALQFNDKGEVIEKDVSLDDLHKAHDDALDSPEKHLDELDDDESMFLDDDNLDDLFEEVDVIPEGETEEEKGIRLAAKQEEDDKLAEEEAKKLAEKNKGKSTPTEDELAKANLRIKELELGNPEKTLRRELPADDAAITTVGDLKKLQADIAFNEQLDKQTYQKDYILSFYKEAYAENMTTTEADTLFDFLVAPENADHNQMHSENGGTDGMINFNKIIRVFQKATKKEIPLKHKKVDTKTLKHGSGIVNKTKKRVIVEKLDPAARRFIQITGMSEDDQVEALEGVSGIHSKGGRAI